MAKEIRLTYKYDEEANKHQSSSIQADTLFNFMNSVDFLITILTKKYISPRYVKEDLKYLNIDSIRSISFPMKCFCDIKLEQLNDHMKWYGSYGIAFSKEWGMKKGIQPVHYINENSDLCKDFSEVLNLVCKKYNGKNKVIDDDVFTSSLVNYVLHNLMYYKPYKGYMRKGETYKMKCFQDECEWRFVPNVEIAGFRQAYIENDHKHVTNLFNESNDMANYKNIALTFEYDEIKHLVCKDEESFNELSNAIEQSKDLDHQTKKLLKKRIYTINK